MITPKNGLLDLSDSPIQNADLIFDDVLKDFFVVLSFFQLFFVFFLSTKRRIAAFVKGNQNISPHLLSCSLGNRSIS